MTDLDTVDISTADGRILVASDAELDDAIIRALDAAARPHHLMVAGQGTPVSPHYVRCRRCAYTRPLVGGDEADSGCRGDRRS